VSSKIVKSHMAGDAL